MEKDYILEYRKMYDCKVINDKIILKEKNEIKGMNTIGMNCEKVANIHTYNEKYRIKWKDVNMEK